MAAVYLAKDMTLGRKVAIKVMAPALLAGEGMVERFKNEAVTVAGLNHPNIIQVYAVRQSGDLQFFVMKFVEGKSLDHIIRDEGALPVPLVRGLLFMIGSALGYAHRRGVVHRDIKPGNILLDEEGNAIVTDFGIAKVTHDSKLTGTGIVIGTPTYISPEQCYARPVTAASDQYSLGVVAYEMLTGRVPFEGAPFTVMQAHTEKPVPPIRQLRPDCPSELEAALMRMLAKDPGERWPSIQHALAALGATALSEGDPARVHLARLAVAGLVRTDEILAAPAAAVGTTDGQSRVPTPAAPPYVAAVAILAPPESVEVGDVFNLGASARNAAGDTMPNARLTWTSDNPSVVAVDALTGVVHAISPGTATIAVSAEGVQNAVTVTVGPRRVAAVRSP
jgi:eukaryotic-like serine/threonine-protein kinase